MKFVEHSITSSYSYRKQAFVSTLSLFVEKLLSFHLVIPSSRFHINLSFHLCRILLEQEVTNYDGWVRAVQSPGLIE